MEILIDDIPEEGLDVSASHEDRWLRDLMADAEGASFESCGKAKAGIYIVRYEDNVTIDGDVAYDLRRICDRCLSDFTDSRVVHVHIVLLPSGRMRRRDEDEVELRSEDLEFGYYDGDRIDLGEVVLEHVVLAESIKHLCKDDCKGLCQRCGKNLNDGPCSCTEDNTDSRWTALKAVKIEPKRKGRRRKSN